MDVKPKKKRKLVFVDS